MSPKPVDWTSNNNSPLAASLRELHDALRLPPRSRIVPSVAPKLIDAYQLASRERVRPESDAEVRAAHVVHDYAQALDELMRGRSRVPQHMITRRHVADTFVFFAGNEGNIPIDAPARRASLAERYNRLANQFGHVIVGFRSIAQRISTSINARAFDSPQLESLDRIAAMADNVGTHCLARELIFMLELDNRGRPLKKSAANDLIFDISYYDENWANVLRNTDVRDYESPPDEFRKTDANKESLRLTVERARANSLFYLLRRGEYDFADRFLDVLEQISPYLSRDDCLDTFNALLHTTARLNVYGRLSEAQRRAAIRCLSRIERYFRTHRFGPDFKPAERAATIATIVDGYVKPILRDLIASLPDRTPGMPRRPEPNGAHVITFPRKVRNNHRTRRAAPRRSSQIFGSSRFAAPRFTRSRTVLR